MVEQNPKIVKLIETIQSVQSGPELKQLLTDNSKVMLYATDPDGLDSVINMKRRSLPKQAEILNQLVALADTLDKRNFTDLASIIDNTIYKVAEHLYPEFEKWAQDVRDLVGDKGTLQPALEFKFQELKKMEPLFFQDASTKERYDNLTESYTDLLSNIVTFYLDLEKLEKSI